MPTPIDVTIAGLPPATTPLTGTELLPLWQSGVTVQTPVSALNASGIPYTPAGTGAVATTVQTKLQSDPISPFEYGAVGNGIADDTAALNAALTAAAAASKWLFTPKNVIISITTDITLPDNVTIFGGGTIQAGTTSNVIHKFIFLGTGSVVTGMTLNNVTTISYYNKNNWEVSDNTFGAILSTDPLVNQVSLLGDLYGIFGGAFEALRVTNYSAGTTNGNATFQPTYPTGFKFVGNKAGNDGYSSWPMSMTNIYAGSYADIKDNTFFARQKLTDALVTNSNGTATANDPTVQFAGLTLTTSQVLNMTNSTVYNDSEQTVGVLWSPTWQQVKNTAAAWVGLALIGANRNYYRVTGKVTSIGALQTTMTSSTPSSISVLNPGSLSVASTGYVLIGTEQVYYSAVSGTSTLTFTVDIRGMNFTTASSHAVSDAVYLVQLGAVSGALGSTEPTHTSGTAINGSVLLTYDGVCSATAPYTYKLNDICAAYASGGQSQYSGYGLLFSLGSGEMHVGQTYRVMNLGATTQAQWNLLGGTSGKTYCVGSVFTAATSTGYSGAEVIPAFLYGSASTLKVTPLNGGIGITGGTKLTVTGNTYHGGKVSLGIDTTPIYTQYQFPIVDNVIERNTLGYANEETLSFDAIAGNGAPFLTTTIAITSTGWSSQSVTLTDNADAVGAVTPVGRILKFLTGVLAGKSFKITAVSGTSVTLGDDWGSFWTENPYQATSGDQVTIEYDVRRNSVNENTIITGSIVLFGIGSDMSVSNNKLRKQNWIYYPNNFPYSNNPGSIQVISMQTANAPKTSTLLGGTYALLAPANLVIEGNVCESQNAIQISGRNEVNTATPASVNRLSLVNNIGGICTLGPLANFVCNGNIFTSYIISNNPNGTLSTQTYAEEHVVLTKNCVMKAGTPTATATTPTAIQQPYINTSTGIFYIAKGTSAPSDFVQIN